MIPVASTLPMAADQLLYYAAIVGGAAVVFLLTFYPAFAAAARRHPHTPLIAVVCMFFGWTCLGWFVALAWAYSDDRR